MRVDLVRLWNLRNYTEATFRPDAGTTLVTGPNGAGKSSLLEAIALFSTLSSPRAGSLKILIREGADEGGAHLEADEGVPLEVRIRGGRSMLKAGGTGVASKTFLGRIRTVLFTPEDLDTVRGEPELRRKALDALVTQLRRGYRGARREYDRALRQRNAAIRQGHRRQAGVYDDPLAAAAAQVLAGRRWIVEELRPRATALYGELAGKGRLDIHYRDTSGSDEVPDEGLEERFRRLYEASLERDLERGRTTVGPHRDDLELEVDGRSARTFASRGEQRSAALALRLGELELLPDATLLLDDVLSELDPDRRERVFGVTEGTQTVVTATEEGAIPSGVAVEARWTVRDGVLDER